MWLLTAPNMAGKSSLMRATLTSALLANCGLLAPVRSARVPRYDAYFLRTSSYDAPAEGKSAFAQEMDDLYVMASECTPRSLVMLDEIGRGTATHEGSALCAALLEWLDHRRISTIFATHLHEIDERLACMPPLRRLHRKCLPARTDPLTGELQMSFTLADGVCTTSHLRGLCCLPRALFGKGGRDLRDERLSWAHQQVVGDARRHAPHQGAHRRQGHDHCECPRQSEPRHCFVYGVASSITTVTLLLSSS